METNRLEAFSDGVLAVIITIMVLELRTPHGPHLSDLFHSNCLSLLTYVLSFLYIGIYWNNHHHLFQLVKEVTGGAMWANLHLLFWLSLYPFTTSWMDDTHLAAAPTIVYGVNLLGAAIAYYVLVQALRRAPETRGHIEAALGSDFKGQISVVIYVIGIALCFWAPWIGLIPYVVVAGIWLVPDRRIERYIRQANASGN